MTLEELIESFSLSGLNKSPAVFDEPKLRWLSGEYVKEMTDEKFLSLAEPFLRRSKAYGKYDTSKLVSLLKTRVEVFEDIPSKIDFLEEYGKIDESLYFNKKMKSDADTARAVLPAVRELFVSLEPFENASVYQALCALAAEKGMKNGQVLWCVRIALTGRENTPGGASEMAELLGRERCLERLGQAAENLRS